MHMYNTWNGSGFEIVQTYYNAQGQIYGILHAPTQFAPLHILAVQWTHIKKIQCTFLIKKWKHSHIYTTLESSSPPSVAQHCSITTSYTPHT